jgi:hypothetical protein
MGLVRAIQLRCRKTPYRAGQESEMKRVSLLLVLLLGFVSVASADTVDFYQTQQNYGATVDMSYTWNDGHTTTYIGNWAGEIYLTSGSSSPFIAYCLSLMYKMEDHQVVDYLPLSTISSPADPEVDPGSGAKVAWLLNTYAPGVDNDDKGAALQLSIFEVLYDSTSPNYDLSSGQFKVLSVPDSAILTLASTYLGSIGSNTSEAYWLNTSNNSDFMGQDLGRAVPEPASFLLLGSGLGALCLSLRRRNK